MKENKLRIRIRNKELDIFSVESDYSDDFDENNV